MTKFYIELTIQGQKNLFPFVGEEMVFGRSPKAGFQIPSSHFSSLHFKVSIDVENRCWLTDLNSTNGTFLDGVKLAPQTKMPLYMGQKISTLGQENFFLSMAIVESKTAPKESFSVHSEIKEQIAKTKVELEQLKREHEQHFSEVQKLSLKKDILLEESIKAEEKNKDLKKEELALSHQLLNLQAELENKVLDFSNLKLQFDGLDKNYREKENELIQKLEENTLDLKKEIELLNLEKNLILKRKHEFENETETVQKSLEDVQVELLKKSEHFQSLSEKESKVDISLAAKKQDLEHIEALLLNSKSQFEKLEIKEKELKHDLEELEKLKLQKKYDTEFEIKKYQMDLENTQSSTKREMEFLHLQHTNLKLSTEQEINKIKESHALELKNQKDEFQKKHLELDNTHKEKEKELDAIFKEKEKALEYNYLQKQQLLENELSQKEIAESKRIEQLIQDLNSDYEFKNQHYKEQYETLEKKLQSEHTELVQDLKAKEELLKTELEALQTNLDQEKIKLKNEIETEYKEKITELDFDLNQKKANCDDELQAYQKLIFEQYHHSLKEVEQETNRKLHLQQQKLVAEESAFKIKIDHLCQEEIKQQNSLQKIKHEIKDQEKILDLETARINEEIKLRKDQLVNELNESIRLKQQNLKDIETALIAKENELQISIEQASQKLFQEEQQIKKQFDKMKLDQLDKMKKIDEELKSKRLIHAQNISHTLAQKLQVELSKHTAKIINDKAIQEIVQESKELIVHDLLDKNSPEAKKLKEEFQALEKAQFNHQNTKVNMLYPAISVASVFLFFIVFPNIPMGIHRGVSSLFQKNDNQIEIEQMRKIAQEEKNKLFYNPPQTLFIKDNYVENILYTQDYQKRKSVQKFHDKWIIELSDFFVYKLDLKDTTVIKFVSLEAKLLRDLKNLAKEIDPKRPEDKINEMKAIEVTFKKTLREMLGDDFKVQKTYDFNKKFWLDNDSQARK